MDVNGGEEITEEEWIAIGLFSAVGSLLGAAGGAAVAYAVAVALAKSEKSGCGTAHYGNYNGADTIDGQTYYK